MAAQGQQQPTTARRETTPVDALQGTMNLLLTVIGKTLQEPGRIKDPAQRMKMQNVFPTANQRFHEALDRMEEEINMAKSILKRDLALHRVQERMKAEKALEPPMEKEVKSEPVPSPMPVLDVDMADAPAKKLETPASIVTTRVMEPVQPKIESQPTMSAPQPAPIAPMVMTAPPPSDPTPAPTITAPEPQQAPADQPLEEMDFSEFFGDDVMGDVDGTTDAANAPAVDESHLEPLADFTDSNLVDDNSADVSSLLPGLGEYADLHDDSAMPDAPPGSHEAAAAHQEPIPGFDIDFGAVAAEGDGHRPRLENPVHTIMQGNPEPDFSEIDFDFSSGMMAGEVDEGQSSNNNNAGGGNAENMDDTFNDLFDNYDFGASGGGGGGDGVAEEDDINAWMKSL